VSARSRGSALLVALALAMAGGVPAHAYLKLGTNVNGRILALMWPGRAPVRYFISDGDVSGVSAAQFRDAVERGFETWEAVSTSTITFEFAGFVGARPMDQDGANVIGFTSRPDLERTLASTSFLVDTRSGEIIESDIFFNSSFSWSVASGGEAGRFDVQSIATHEAGHFLGLGHSLLGETEARPTGGRRLIASAAVMFPIAFNPGNIVDRELAADDIAGVSDVYPASGFRGDTGTLQGTVTKSGRGIFGAHVVAFNPTTGDLVGGFSLDDAGAFAIAGLSPGTYIVRVEPLDDGDTDSFFEKSANVDANFKAAYYPRLVTVPKGGGSARIKIEVQPK
jgi:Matrixin